MKVSVVIPMYNQKAEYFRECLESAVNQTYPKDDYEIIVVNDGSSKDETLKELQRWKDKEISNMKFIDKPNGKTASALNAGIKAMKGEWFMWLSSDDVWMPDKIEQQMLFMKEKRPDGKIFYCDWLRINSMGNIIKKEIEPEFETKEDVVFHLCFRFFGCGSGIMIHKNVFEKVGMFNENVFICEDYEMWFRIAKEFMFYKVPIELMKYRTHSGMLTNDPKSKKAYIEVVEKGRESVDYKDVVSVVIIAYNEEETIRKCIDSVLQDSQYIGEIIVVNDASTDKTEDIVKQIEKAPCEISLINFQENKGRGFAKMYGIKKAKHRLVCTVDADIILKKGWLDFLLKNMVIFGGVSAFAGSVEWINTKRKPWCDEINLIMTKIGQSAIGTVATLFHKSLFKKYPIDVNLKDGEDSDLFLRLERDEIPFFKSKEIIGSHVDNMSLEKFLMRNYEYGGHRAMLWNRHKDLMGTPTSNELSDRTKMIINILETLREGCALLGFKEEVSKLEKKMQFPKWGEKK